jgi:hypothetical protein
MMAAVPKAAASNNLVSITELTIRAKSAMKFEPIRIVDGLFIIICAASRAVPNLKIISICQAFDHNEAGANRMQECGRS